MGGYYVIRTYRAGQMVEKSKIWVPSQAKVRAGRVKGNTSAAKRDRNAMQAVRVLARSMNCNCDHKWLHMVCNLDDAHLEAFDAEPEKPLKNFRARMQRAVKKLGGGQIAYYEVVSHKDAETGAEKRLHVHYVIRLDGVRFENGRWMLGDKALEDIWGMGGVWAEPLHQQPDYTPLALYLLRQADRDGKKAYNPSRNLKKPIVTETLALTGRQLRAPAGAVVMENRWDAVNGANYIRYKAPAKEAQREKTKKQRE